MDGNFVADVRLEDSDEVGSLKHGGTLLLHAASTRGAGVCGAWCQATMASQPFQCLASTSKLSLNYLSRAARVAAPALALPSPTAKNMLTIVSLRPRINQPAAAASAQA